MDDLISRAALLNRVPKCDMEMHVMDIKRLINRQTAVDAEPVRCGEWINSGDCVVCSECSSVKPTKAQDHKLAAQEIRFCYYCGARMNEKEG